MERLVFIDTRFGGVYLHRFPASRFRPIITAHDHPWDFVTVVLRGGYDEALRVGGDTPRRRGSVAIRWASTRHRLRLHVDGALTLCVRGPTRRDWSWTRLPS
jgi:hypothetical protein